MPISKRKPSRGGNRGKKHLECIERLLHRLIRKVDRIMPTLQERFDQVNANLTEASTEILAELANLRGMNLPPEAEASLEAIEARANALKDVSPPVP